MSQYGTAPDLSAFAVNSYDGGWLVIYGAAWSFFNEPGMQITGVGVSRGLRHVSMGSSTDIRPANWPQVVSAFRQHMSVDVNGASGTLNFDPATNETTAPIEVWNVDTTVMPAVFHADYTLNF
jgi:branched-chain amino acid transport system substrate-binding protein